MGERKHIQLYRSSGTTEPNPSDVMFGELSIGYKGGHERLYIKNTEETITSFSSDLQRNQQEKSLANATGLVSNTSQGGSVSYSYDPSAETLLEFDNMSESVDFLAVQVMECLAAIEDFKQNIYTIDTNFTVEPNSAYTSYIASYSCTYNGNPTAPSACTITRYVNNGAGEAILENEGVSSYDVTVSVTGNKEQYVLEVTPDLPRALHTRSEVTMYMCMVGASSATTMTAQIASGFRKFTSNGKSFVATDIQTETAQYIWIIVPSYINVRLVMAQGITFTLDDEVQTVSDIGGITGTYKCYRSNMELDAATWSLVIYNVLS